MFFKVEDLVKAYGGLVASNHVSLEIEEHEIVGLIGPNGAGKSTLFQMTQGFVTPDSGKILFRGKDITKLPPYKVCAEGIGCTFQHAQLFPDLDVTESVLIGAYSHTKRKSEAMKQVEELLAFFDLGDKRHMTISKLNMFDRKRVEMMAALATRPVLLMLDEIFAGLNPTEVEEMIDIVTKVHREMKVTLFLVEHVIKVINRICDRVYVLDYGKIIAACKPEELSGIPQVVKAYLGDDYDADASK